MKLFLVRHGETDSNSSLRFWGKTDVGLGPVGLKQAEQICRRLSGEKIDFIYSSPMKRAMLTARTIASAHGLEITGCPELREVDFGKLEGFCFDEVQYNFPEVAEMWLKRDPSLAYPGGESLIQMDERVSWFKTRLKSHSERDTLLVVAHAGVLRTLICQLLNPCLNIWNLQIDLASLSIIEVYPGTAILTLLNDTCHLRDNTE